MMLIFVLEYYKIYNKLVEMHLELNHFGCYQIRVRLAYFVFDNGKLSNHDSCGPMKNR